MNSTIVIEQSDAGYRHAQEPLLLADFVRAEPDARILDVGTGCGIIALRLAVRLTAAQICAIDIQPDLVAQARSNAVKNGLESRVTVVAGDFTREPFHFAERSFDRVVSNPPFGKLNAGRLNPDPAKAVARHEVRLTMDSLVAGARRMLKPSGRLAVVYPEGRWPELEETLGRHGFRLVRMERAGVSPFAAPKWVLVEAESENPNGGMVESAQTLYNANEELK